MKKLLKKELALATAKLTWYFTAFGLMALIPGYPILVGAFFVSLGIFKSFEYAREANDILYCALLPIRKRDVVKAKYLSTVLFQMISFLIFALCTVLRMTVLKNAAPYVNNALMAANLTFLGFVLLIYAAFNTVFLGGFFKTAYYTGKPFLLFIIAAFLLVGIGEALHFIPGNEWINAMSGTDLPKQAQILAMSIVVYVLSGFVSLRKSQKRFEMIDIT